MQLNHPVSIDLLTFCQTAKFDCIEPGQSSEWILNNFPDPDSIADMGHGVQIWTYGNIEFHFADNALLMIFSDHFSRQTLHGGNSLDIRPWIFTKKQVLLKNALQELNYRQIDYQKTTTKLNIAVRLSSGVVLYFENSKDIAGLDPNRYRLIAFALRAGRSQPIDA